MTLSANDRGIQGRFQDPGAELMCPAVKAWRFAGAKGAATDPGPVQAALQIRRRVLMPGLCPGQCRVTRGVERTRYARWRYPCGIHALGIDQALEIFRFFNFPKT
jgi:hypothetical protein